MNDLLSFSSVHPNYDNLGHLGLPDYLDCVSLVLALFAQQGWKLEQGNVQA